MPGLIATRTRQARNRTSTTNIFAPTDCLHQLDKCRLQYKHYLMTPSLGA